MKSAALCFSLAIVAFSGLARAATLDVPIGYVPPARVSATLKKTLSPQGRFVMLTPQGPVRIIDTDAKVREAQTALEALQKSPALISLNLSFVVHSKKTVERRVVEMPQGGSSFPYPTSFSPPKITRNGNTTVVVPTQPTKFSNKTEGASGTVTTKTDMVPTRDIIRRVAATSTPPQPSTQPLLPKVEDPAGLHALAVKLGAVPAAEPVWTTAGTELLLRTELTGGQLLVSVTPQIVLPAVGGQPARHIPLKMCAAVIPLTRAAANPTGTLPRADAEFYRLFLGAPPPAAPDAITALSVAADVRYAGTQAP